MTTCRAAFARVTKPGILRPPTAASTETTACPGSRLPQRRSSHQPTPPMTPATASATTRFTGGASSRPSRKVPSE